MIFVMALNQDGDYKSSPVNTGQLGDLVRSLPHYKMWIDVVAPMDVEITELELLFGIDRSLLINGNGYNIEFFKHYISFNMVSCYLDEDKSLGVNPNKNPIIVKVPIKFFIFKDKVITLHWQSFTMSNNATRIMSNVSYDKFVCSSVSAISNEILDDYAQIIFNMRSSLNILEDRVTKNYIEEVVPLARYNKKKWSILNDILEYQKNMCRPARLAVMPTVSDETYKIFSQLYEQFDIVSQSLTNIKDTIESIFNLHLSLLQAETNKRVYILTIITVLIAPLTVLTGYYGMNFKYLAFAGFMGNYGGWVIGGLLGLYGAISAGYILRKMRNK